MSNPDTTAQVPSWPKLLRPLLEVVSDGQVWKTKALAPAVSEQAKLSEAQLSVVLNSGQLQAYNRVGWALYHLTRATAVNKIRNGESQITELGRQLLDEHPSEITVADLEQIPIYRDYVPKKRVNTSPAVNFQRLPSFWFVGAYDFTEDGGDMVGDQTERYVNEGRWANRNAKYTDLVKAMKPGERIAIKATFTRLHDLPFITKGNRVSVMAIKATGTIAANHGDGYIIDVDWDPIEPVREWYFYTNQRTVWQLKAHDWKSKALIDFAFDGADQDYDEFRNADYWAERFGDDAPEVIDDESADTTEEETPTDRVYGISDIVADGCFVSEQSLQGYLNALERKKNLILQGPPGTGKTWLAKRLGRSLTGADSAELLQSVQFHPSLSYEDFVRGWRPSGDGRLALSDGLFLDLIKKAENTPGSKHVLVIEEINRGNLAQIFGELLTLLEADKRTPAEALTLTYRKAGEGPLHIPENLYLIGTMNLADRSLAIVDFALRRRFAFADLTPQFNQRWQAWVSERNGVPAGMLAALAERLDVVNRHIADDHSLGEQYRIGHSFFTPAHDTAIADPASWIRDVIAQEITPLLAEYWFDDREKTTAQTTTLLGAL